MDHQTNQNPTEESKKTTERKRHGSVGFAVASVALLLVIVGLVIFIIMKMSDNQAKETVTPLSSDATFEVAESSPKDMADQIESAQGLKSEETSEEASEESSDQTTSSTEESLEGEETEPTQESEEASQETEESQEATEESTEASSTAETKKQEETETQSTEAKKETTQKQTASTDPETRVIDFATLQTTKNAHIYAWISVPGTNIDYPILRHPSDDGYYLYHNLNGSQGYPGCIYTENCNSKDWTDPVTVMYGHDMRSTGTMFHQLHKFESQSFFDKHEYFYIYTPEKTLKYQIFSAYVHSNEHLLGNHNFSDKDTFDSFFGTVLSTNVGNSHARAGVTVTSDSKVVALSTCIKNKPENRYIIFGVLVN